MDVILKQKGNKIGVYIDNKLNTVFENKSIEDVTGWIDKNLLSVKIQVIRQYKF